MSLRLANEAEYAKELRPLLAAASRLPSQNPIRGLLLVTADNANDVLGKGLRSSAAKNVLTILPHLRIVLRAADVESVIFDCVEILNQANNWQRQRGIEGRQRRDANESARLTKLHKLWKAEARRFQKDNPSQADNYSAIARAIHKWCLTQPDDEKRQVGAYSLSLRQVRRWVAQIFGQQAANGQAD